MSQKGCLVCLLLHLLSLHSSLHRLQREMQASPIPVSPTAIRELVCDLDEQGVQDLVAELCSHSERAQVWRVWRTLQADCTDAGVRSDQSPCDGDDGPADLDELERELEAEARCPRAASPGAAAPHDDQRAAASQSQGGHGGRRRDAHSTRTLLAHRAKGPSIKKHCTLGRGFSATTLLDNGTIKALDRVYAGRSPPSLRAQKSRFAESPVEEAQNDSNGEDMSPSDRKSPRDKGNLPSAVSRLLELLEQLHTGFALKSQEQANMMQAEICSQLFQFPFFQHFDEVDVIALAKVCKRVQVPKGRILFVQGDHNEDGVYFILHGNLNLLCHSDASDEEMRASSAEWSDLHQPTCSGPEVEQTFGLEIGSASSGTSLVENALLDERLQQPRPLNTAIASSFVSALKLCKNDLKQHGLLDRVLSRTIHVIHHPQFSDVRQLAETEPQERSEEQLNAAKRILFEVPFFMNFHGWESGPNDALRILLKHLVLLPELSQTEVLWHEGSSMDDKRMVLHIILKGEVKCYSKGSTVDPLQLTSIDWFDPASVGRVIGKESAATASVGNVIGGPAEVSHTAEETIVGMKGCIFATVNKHVWKQALVHITRPFLFKPQAVRRALAQLETAPTATDCVCNVLPTNSAMNTGRQSRNSGAEEVIPGISRGPSLNQSDNRAPLVAATVQRDYLQDKSVVTTLLESFRFFCQVPLKRLVALSSKFRMIHVPRHETLCLRGSDCKGIFVMLVGMAKVYSDALSLHRIQKSQQHKSLSADGIETERSPPGQSGLPEYNQDESQLASNTDILPVHHQISGLHPEAKLQVLGEQVGELYCGDVVFEREAAHGLPYSATMMAGNSFFNAIFIDSETFATLTSPTPPLHPPSWMLTGIAVADIVPAMRSSEQNEDLAQSLKNVPGLDHLDIDLLRELGPHVSLKRFAMESLVTQYATKPDAIHVLLEGTVSIHDPPRSEARSRRLHGNSGNSSHLGQCVRIGIPGQEPFGLTSMILSVHHWNSVACRTDCLFYCLRKEDMSRDLYSRFESFCQRKAPCTKSISRERIDRKDHEILNIVNYLKENPFFCNLNSLAHQRLASTIGMMHLSKGELVSTKSNSDQSAVKQLAVVNKGSICTMATTSDAMEFTSLRLQPFQLMNHRGVGRANDVSADGGADNRDIGAVADGVGHVGAKSDVTTSTSGADAGHGDGVQLHSHVLATYGLGFWSGVVDCISDQDGTEVFAINKSEWRKIMSMLSNTEASDVVSFISKHPCFQGLKSSEIQNLAQQSKQTNLKERAMLFKDGETQPDLLFMMEGSIQLRTEISLHRNALSAGVSHVIPSITVASLGHQAIINDVIDLSNGTQAEVLDRWLGHGEIYTAVAEVKCSVVAVSKAAVVTVLNRERQSEMMEAKKEMDAFHEDRRDVLTEARHGLIHGKAVLPWFSPQPPKVKEESDILSAVNNKIFCRRAPRPFIPKNMRHVAEDAADPVTMPLPGYLPALVSPRFTGLKMGRTKHTHNLMETLPETTSHVCHDVTQKILRAPVVTPRTILGLSPDQGFSGPREPDRTKQHLECMREKGQKMSMHISTRTGEKMQVATGFSTMENSSVSILLGHTERVLVPGEAVARHALPGGGTARERYLAMGRPGNTVINAMTKAHLDRKAQENQRDELRRQERDAALRQHSPLLSAGHLRSLSQNSGDHPTVEGRCVWQRHLRAGDVLRTQGANPLPPLFTRLVLDEK